ncbi:aromatic amino acid transaminase [Saccharospirillum sp.]|uniref:aromatic amino acid transaminase n=1 Tax=Saccharospirillum sp. TaxID=2033801 RepID=UPI00349FF506
MFERLNAPKQDPILGLTLAIQADQRSDKIDLGIGVYRNADGETPIMAAVRQAQREQAETQTTKSYIGLAGNETFNTALIDLLLGGTAAHTRAAGIQTPGASGALRMLAELIKTARPDATVWISNPSYVNHRPVMAAAGLNVAEYPYFDVATKQVDEAAMLDQIATFGEQDVLLLHGCCHNPTGADISMDAWQRIAELAEQRGFLPFVDIAYQGFGDGLMEDAAGLRLLADRLPELIIATSCSKNFGLYRERTGAAIVVGHSLEESLKAKGRILEVARGSYTMPPDHGAALVAAILGRDDLKALWMEELMVMNQRINSLRSELVRQFREISGSDRFDYFGQHRGMFSVTGLGNEQIDALRVDHGIYMVGGGRMNVAGLAERDIPRLAECFLTVGA